MRSTVHLVYTAWPACRPGGWRLRSASIVVVVTAAAFEFGRYSCKLEVTSRFGHLVLCQDGDCVLMSICFWMRGVCFGILCLIYTLLTTSDLVETTTWLIDMHRLLCILRCRVEWRFRDGLWPSVGTRQGFGKRGILLGALIFF